MRAALLAPLACGLVASTLAAGCSSDEGAKAAEPAPAALEARDYYPLAVGNTWTYRSTPGDEVRKITIVREEDGFFIDNNTPPARLQTRSTGVYDGDRFLLEEPLEVGHKWLAVPSASTVERYEIVATDLELSTPAGFFKDCVRVKAETTDVARDGRPVKLMVLWTYAPGVGLIRIEQRVAMAEEPAQTMMTIELVKFSLAGDEPDAQGSNKP